MSVPPFMGHDYRNDAKTIEGHIVEMVPGKRDVVRAAELKKQVFDAMIPVLQLMDEAARDGFLVRWAGLAPNAFGKHEIVDFHLLKRF
jgi:hypothetical protein